MNAVKSQSACPPRILEAYKNGVFTDLTITCGSLTFEVHQLVVGTMCAFFGKCINFPGKEAEEKCIDLPDDDPEMIRRLIAYLYLGDYDPCNNSGISAFNNIKQYASTTATLVVPVLHSRNISQCACLAPSAQQSVPEPESKDRPSTCTIEKSQKGIEVAHPLTIHATMYALADKYGVDGLEQIAKEKFESCLDHYVHVNPGDFVTAVQLAYTGTPASNRGLRDAVVKVFRIYFKVNVTEIPGVEAKLDTIDELSFLLIKSWPMKTESPKSAKLTFGALATTTPSSLAATGSGAPAATSSGTGFGAHGAGTASVLGNPPQQRAPGLFGGAQPLPAGSLGNAQRSQSIFYPTSRA
ncbi:hypothetical protein EJ02DRAFT_399544 [Clathrospora elynae]|uniref:BTB domain-containing protein n=1 Tax=Clathrospora elynae TaxID=706981 RepID=A0A6A5SUG2_9PLEO|nr:hypothetical protein EJ02DRAFT_399544 [Clathrospora elynae]